MKALSLQRLAKLSKSHWGNLTAILSVAVISLLGSGCGYTVGNTFRPEIRSVYVPVFENDTFRKGIEHQLTAAVQKQIGTRTPYKLSKGPEADTRLVGRIVGVGKSVLGETANDDPRQLEMQFAIHITWEDQRSGQVLAKDDLPLPVNTLPVTVTTDFAPEIGQSRASATSEAMDQLARRIVNLMETPW